MSNSAENLEDSVRTIINFLLDDTGVSLREISRRTGVAHTTLGEKLRRGRAIHISDLVMFCEVLELSPWEVVAAAEWMVYGQPPEGLTRQEQIDVAALFEAAARYRDKDYATPAASKPTPLFSDRRNDGYYGDEALPRMA